jgi:hypothetical protein
LSHFGGSEVEIEMKGNFFSEKNSIYIQTLLFSDGTGLFHWRLKLLSQLPSSIEELERKIFAV